MDLSICELIEVVRGCLASTEYRESLSLRPLTGTEFGKVQAYFQSQAHHVLQFDMRNIDISQT